MTDRKIGLISTTAYRHLLADIPRDTSTTPN